MNNNNQITLSRAVVEQALKALERADRIAGYKNNWSETVALRAALEQPQVEQEPVAWIERWYGSGPERGWWIVCGRDHIAHLGPAEMSGEAASKIVSAHNTSPPAQRQPLTEEEIRDLFQNQRAFPRLLKFIRVIEAAHGIGGEK